VIEGLFAPMHLLVIGAIALLVFGPSRLPELGRGLGKAIRSFKAGLDEGEAPQRIEAQTDQGAVAQSHPAPDAAQASKPHGS
jgi:sec-independent protein translocase protein TatA